MLPIIPSRNVTKGDLYPLRRFLKSSSTPYSLAWKARYFANDIASRFVGNDGRTVEKAEYQHEVYRSYAQMKNRSFDHQSGMLEVMFQYVYPRVLRQVGYYFMPHNPNCPNYYTYFKHLATLLCPQTDSLLIQALKDWVNLADRVYAKWDRAYTKAFWTPDFDVREFDSGIIYGDYGSGVYIPSYPNPPIPHPFTLNGSDPLGYVRDFGKQTASFDDNYEGIPYPEIRLPQGEDDEVEPIPDVPDPEPSPDVVPSPDPEPLPSPVVFPMPEPRIRVSQYLLEKLQELWNLYLMGRASITDIRTLEAYGVLPREKKDD